MNERIIYQQPSQSVSIVIPLECGLSILDIAKKDVPFGLPFWIVDASTIPADRTLRDAWSIDVEAMGPPDGNGGTYILGADK